MMLTLISLLQFAALPEVALLVLICVILLIELFVKQRQGTVTYVATQLCLLVTLFLVFHARTLPSQIILNGHFVWNSAGYVIKSAIVILSIFSLVYVRDSIKEKAINAGEFYLLGLFSILGMLVSVSANSLLVLYLGLELISFPLYTLVVLQRGCSMAAEAGIKYFILGALASALFLYGLSLIYGATHSLIISDINAHLLDTVHGSPLTSGVMRNIAPLGLVFIVAGIAFKLGAVPFHLWAPDVYQGAPTAVTLFVSAAPKIAGLAIAIRLLVDAFPLLHAHWQPLLSIIAFCSFALGNLVAIVQKNIKRMLAYSAIAHIGYTLLGFVAGNAFGYAMSLFYILMYALMALTAFGVLIAISSSGHEVEAVNDLRGLNARSPWLALLMLVTMFSMAGIPPTVGFFAKIGVLQALIAVHKLWLGVFAILFAIIGSYYYLNVVKVMYFEEPEPTLPCLRIAQSTYLVLSINAILIVIFGLFPTQLIALTKLAFTAV